MSIRSCVEKLVFFIHGGFAMIDDERREESSGAEDSTVYMYLLRYKGALYACECVEQTPDTCIFQVDASFVRKGLFPKNRLDMRWFKEMNIELVPVHHAPVMEM